MSGWSTSVARHRSRPNGGSGRLLSFHFPSELDNSGFVGWLAGLLKRELGTGVFVVCGQNSRRGGIYDYWGCPAQLRGGAAHVIQQLRAVR